jgi:hypothetical protein
VLGCLFTVLSLPGCTKEYSYEGGPLPDTIPVIDTIPTSVLHFARCSACDEVGEPVLSSWNFTYGTSLLCGSVTRAIIAPERNAFTFFGPSACSTDTGLVMTVFLGTELLNGDKSNLTTNQVVFEYYDNTTLIDIFMTDHLGPFSLTIDTYTSATGIAKGTFRGFVPDKNGQVAEITNGKFQVKFDP